MDNSLEEKDIFLLLMQTTVPQPLRPKSNQKQFFCPFFFFLNLCSSRFLPLYKWQCRLFAFPGVCLCLTAEQWENKVKQRRELQPFRKHAFEHLHSCSISYSLHQITGVMQNTNHSRLLCACVRSYQRWISRDFEIRPQRGHSC